MKTIWIILKRGKEIEAQEQGKNNKSGSEILEMSIK